MSGGRFTGDPNAGGGNAIDAKPSNPKDAIGSKKLDLSLAPATLQVMAATAFLEGALKYGRYNWRIAGVRASIYVAALLRHVFKWYNGQDHDTTTRVHHLDNAIACLAIMRDAELYGKLNDDRPPAPDRDAMAKLIDSQADIVAHLQKMFAVHNPHQYTIADTPQHEDGAAFACGGTNSLEESMEARELIDLQFTGSERGDDDDVHLPSFYKLTL